MQQLTGICAGLPEGATIHDVRSGRRWTAAEIRAETSRRAEKLAEMPTDVAAPRCVIAVADAAEALLWTFGAWSAGFTVILVNPAITAFERDNITVRTRPALWIGDMGVESLMDVSGPVRAGAPLGPDAPALVLMTSGTTGVPKGIVHTQRSLQARIALNIAAIGASPLRQSLCVLPVFFGHGLIGNCLTPLAAGGTLHLWTSPTLAETGGLATVLADQRITFMSSVPTFWKLAMRVSPRTGHIVERIHVGSAPLAYSQWAAIADWTGTRNVWNMFGMTETANWIGGAALDDAAGRDGHVGHPWGGRIAILANDGGIRETGRGEALVMTPSIMTGYLDQPELTDAAFCGPWFRTGDIGEIDEAGSLTLVGRLKFEINRAGIKIQAEEIDLMLERHPQVIEACAFGIPDPASGEAVAAAIVLAPGEKLDVEAIRNWCRSQVRPEAVPVRLFAVSEIPRNERGKIVRGAVRDAVLSGSASP